MSSSFCSSCQIELQNDNTIREHYKSEFHRYNIKRKLVGLAPVTTDQFSQKKAQLIAESSQSERDQLFKCELCSKTFASKATYKQHLESKKHRENLRKFNQNGKEGAGKEEKRSEIVSSKINTANDQSICLFCNKKSENIDENLVHMRLTHSFFISEWRHLKDLKGLLQYLGNKVHKTGMCIYCGNYNNKETKVGESAQHHMLDKGHVFMDTEDFEEYQRFYDFSRVFDELKKLNLVADANDIVIEEDEYLELDLENEEERENEDDWEIIDEKGQEGKQRSKTYRLKKAVLLDSGEIRLPNGQILGHRRYRNIYRQYFRETARQNQLDESAIEYGGDKAIAAIEEENRLAVINQEIIRKQRNLVESQAHKFFIRKEKDALRLNMKTNKAQHYFRKQEN